jgi:hypothetical protein
MHKSLIALSFAIFVATMSQVATASASDAPTWAPAATAAVHPGVQTDTDGAQCTSNFVFYDASSAIYLGQAAHCAGTGSSADTNGWTHLVYTVSPGIPGDSGSGFMDATGKAFGVLSTLQIAPLPAANGVSDLSRMLAYMKAHGGPDVTLANGTEPFTGSIVG